MKTLVNNYTFNKTTKQITFTGLDEIKISQILLITNMTNNVVIYSFADPALGGTVSGNVLTLTYNTSAMSNTDPLQIFIDTPNYEDLEALGNALMDSFSALATILQTTRSHQSFPDAAGRTRVNVEAGTLTGVTTVSTLSNMASIGGYAAGPFLVAQTNQGWASLRNKISLS